MVFHSFGFFVVFCILLHLISPLQSGCVGEPGAAWRVVSSRNRGQPQKQQIRGKCYTDVDWKTFIDCFVVSVVLK